MTKQYDNKYLPVLGIILWCMLCIGTLFVISEKFVNPEITPKRFGLMIGTGVATGVWIACCRNIFISGRAVFLLLLFCVSATVIRDRVVSGLNHPLLAYSVCLPLLFFLLRQITGVCSPERLFGTVLVLAGLLALYGILQYIGVFSAPGRQFSVTGAFDNPAGFGAALACVFPYGFYFLRGAPRSYKYIAPGVLVVIAAGVILSGARSAMAACLVAAACYLFVGSSKVKLNRPIKVGAACLAAAVVFGLYWLKKDSADGRLLIWRCTADMIKDAPIAGHGQGAFAAKYMLYQAAYFQAHPESRYALLADNVTHPFNEYLSALSEHGIIGLCCLGFAIFLLFKAYSRKSGCEKVVAGLSLLSLAVFSCFSYPFKYPFTWLMVMLNLVLISRTDESFLFGRSAGIARILSVAGAVFLLWLGIPLMKAEIRWNDIARQSLAGRTAEVLPEYDRLYRRLGKDGLFLYNHAAELHEVKEFERSIAVFEHCMRYYNDMDVQMLLADNYKESGKYTKAERHLKTAAAMCPARFMPLYESVKLYDATGRKDEALAVARKIIDKDVKVPSPTVIAIKNEMHKLAEERNQINKDICDSATQGRTSDEP